VERVQFYANIPFADGVRETAAEAATIGGPQAVQFAVSQFPEGATYIGNEVRRFVGGPVNYVTKVLLPRQRPDIKEFRVLGSEDMKKWADSSECLAEKAPGVQATAQAARVRIAYVEDGRTIHGDFLILLPRMQMARVTYWVVESASSVRAEAGQLEPLLKLHQAMLFSLKTDLNWFNRERQVATMLQDAFFRQQARTMELSRYIARTNDEVTASISQAYRNRQKSLDRIHHNFSQYMRGVDSYASPVSSTRVELPSGYNHAWVNGLGEYVLSNDSFFNPNQTLSGNWSKLSPAR